MLLHRAPHVHRDCRTPRCTACWRWACWSLPCQLPGRPDWLRRTVVR